MHSLDVLGMVVAPGAAHASGFDVIGNCVVEAAKLFAADRAPSLSLYCRSIRDQDLAYVKQISY